MNNLEKWSKLTIQEKIKYNGYDGFVKNETFRETSIFKKSKPSEEFR